MYSYYCEPHELLGMVSQIVVGNATSATPLSVEDIRVYQNIHGFFMFFAFGVVLPFGGFMAASGNIYVHKYMQVFGLSLALVGLVLIEVFTQKRGTGHFQQIHSFCGVVLLALALCVQPLTISIAHLTLFKNLFVRALHRRNGQLLVFFGIANVFMGIVVIDAAPVYRVLYGLWVGLMIAVYVLYQPEHHNFKRGSEAGKRVDVPAAGPRKNKVDVASPTVSVRHYGGFVPFFSLSF